MKAIYFTAIAVAGFSFLQAAEPEPVTADNPGPSTPKAAKVPSPAEQPELIDTMSDGELEAAIDAVKRRFLDPEASSNSGLRRATLHGLLLRLSPGIKLSDEAPTAEATQAFVAEILDGHIGYLRPGTLDSGALSQFDTTLASFINKGVDSVILDLRENTGHDNFEVAAELTRRLSPRGQVLFTLEKPSAKQERIFTSHDKPLFQGPLVVLTDNRTRGGGEAAAGALRQAAGAMVIGSPTAGAAVEYETVRLGSDDTLDIATSRVLLPDGQKLYPKGLQPDISIALAEKTQKAIFERSIKEGVSGFVYAPERIRFNEAALVANTNPELDTLGERSQTKPQDTVLQRAVDLVTALRFHRDFQPAQQ